MDSSLAAPLGLDPNPFDWVILLNAIIDTLIGSCIFDYVKHHDAMKSSEMSTTENKRTRRSVESQKKGKGRQGKNKDKSKSRTSLIKKVDTTMKGKGKELQKRKEPSKKKRETSHVRKLNSKQGPSTKRNKGDKEVSKQQIVDNLRLQKVLGGRVLILKLSLSQGGLLGGHCGDPIID
ncbi:hypothetical protein KY290_021392 [Solanum tuberosum]|uniref:Uncharacterized protein n=1 Tax=Solanum tuberosum TaxID=4113 RepID=A0ABQ7V2Z1_SOLTU|nr:hypothetical protein KY289_020557 [Solanum tuberosum]KAH0693224.1 hypothetical protein KY285_020321 [Solanum tuberosum]KAH0757899.1 hypothetical protein KY290_021392 [Solanum tuberosum]